MNRGYAMQIVVVVRALSMLSSLARAQEKAPAAPYKGRGGVVANSNR